jgi:hypothetical protein
MVSSIGEAKERSWTNMPRFTGPKITLDVSELTEEQEKVLREEGLDIEIEGLDRTPSSNEADGEMKKAE